LAGAFAPWPVLCWWVLGCWVLALLAILSKELNPFRMFLKIETQHFYNEKGIKRLMPIGFKKKEGEG